MQNKDSEKHAIRKIYHDLSAQAMLILTIIFSVFLLLQLPKVHQRPIENEGCNDKPNNF